MRKWAAGFLILAAAVLFYVACGESPTSPGTTTTAFGPSGGPFGPSGGPFGPGGGPFGPSGGPYGPSGGPYGPSGGPGGPSTPPPSSPPPSSPPPSSPPPSSPPPSSPPPVVLQISNLFVATGKNYQVIQSGDCCSNAMGRAWDDWPYVLQSNFGANPVTDPLYMIQTSTSDTNALSDPMITFDINICATVDVIFGEQNSDLGCNDPYPGWIQSGGWACSVQGCAGSVATFNHETLGSADQVFGPRCRRNFPAGNVALGPREPTQGDPDDKMYTVFVKAPAFGPCP